MSTTVKPQEESEPALITLALINFAFSAEMAFPFYLMPVPRNITLECHDFGTCAAPKTVSARHSAQWQEWLCLGHEV